MTVNDNDNMTLPLQLAVERVRKVADMTRKMGGPSPHEVLLYAALCELREQDNSYDDAQQMILLAWSDLDTWKSRSNENLFPRT